ncbi:hypothetical protein FGG08_005985 [Glutinoglossum americanum]|uniref:Extracellular mutant protein 11 C-terminal domain-containing protein n=1 Tax=Glutinoglossum americanum TaxID=1670608 RepID=A0A9P8KVG6_9PEZI|nr:hypothetical protein FGG08_005985 [Glutinoglossum americanum]
MSHGVENFVAKRSSIPPIARRQIAASLKIKQTPTVHQPTPQRNQLIDSSRYTSSSGLSIGQKHIGQIKDEHTDSRHGILEDTKRFPKDAYDTGFSGNIHERDVQADIHQDVFDTDVGEDFDQSISGVQAPNSQRGFRVQNVIHNLNRPGSQSGESLEDDDDDNSASGDDDEGEFYTRDPDQTVTINENLQLEQTAFSVALRAKPEGQTRFQPHDQRAGGNPRSRMVGELGSYPVATVGRSENTEETQCTDIIESQLGEQTMLHRQGTSRIQVRPSGGLRRYYGSGGEGENRGMTRSSRTPGITATRAASGVDAKGKRYEEQLDYSPVTLAVMTYEGLQNQPFDMDPNGNPLILPPELSSAPLSDQLTHISTLPADQKRQFFSSLSLDSWEGCGDWFVDRFAGVVKKMTELRKEKRKIAIAFEEEIASRQNRVRAKTEHLGTVMSRMQREGKVLLEEKAQYS